eukprot:TRINITY_DN4063_c0_g1_i1.p1 TRINITY_DN4063_c0_g1~~TRINITY_DN4063_c0_g1_i1.p1  ORF type:complete len:1107 (+),score=194.76 TRINITY_DN4063_c0_g1_i1:100-3420(+)
MNTTKDSACVDLAEISISQTPANKSAAMPRFMVANPKSQHVAMEISDNVEPVHSDTNTASAQSKDPNAQQLREDISKGKDLGPQIPSNREIVDGHQKNSEKRKKSEFAVEKLSEVQQVVYFYSTFGWYMGASSTLSALFRKIPADKAILIGKLWNIAFVVAVFLSIAMLCASTLPQYYEESESGVWFYMEAALTAFFTLDLFIGLLTTPWKVFFTRPMSYVDIAALIPFYASSFIDNVPHFVFLRSLRLARIIGVFHIHRQWKGYTSITKAYYGSRYFILVLLFLYSLYIMIASTIVFFVERGSWDEESESWIVHGARSKFQSLPFGFWWCMATLTTVGYGDIAPTTTIGRLFAILSIIIGIMFLSSFVAVIGARFKHEWGDRKKKKEERNRSTDPAKPAPLERQKENLKTMFDKSTVQKIHEFLQGNRGGKYHVIYQAFIISSTVGSIIVMILLSYPEGSSVRIDENLARKLEALFSTILSIDLFLRISTAKHPIKYAKRFESILEFIALVPFYIDLVIWQETRSLPLLRITRVIRICRIFFLGHFSLGFRIIIKTLVASKQTIMLLTYILMVDLLFFSSFLYYLERGDYHNGAFCQSVVNQECQPSLYESIPAAMWWGIATVTTVGYGDVVPRTTLGFLICSLAMFTGVAAVALPVAIIGENFSTAWKSMNEKYANKRLVVFGKNGPALDPPKDVKQDKQDKPNSPKPNESFLHLCLSKPEKSVQATGCHLFSLTLAMVGLLVLFCESLYDPSGDVAFKIRILDAILQAILLLEILLRVFSSSNPVSQFKRLDVITDFGSVLPSAIFLIRAFSGGASTVVLSGFRITRLFRFHLLLKLSRRYKAAFLALLDSWKALFLTFFLLIIEVIFFSSILYFVEAEIAISRNSDQAFSSIPDAFWFMVITLLTIGYGLTSSLSWAGKLVTGIAAVFGLLTVTLPISIITGRFQEKKQELESKEPLTKLVLSLLKSCFIPKKDDEKNIDSPRTNHPFEVMAKNFFENPTDDKNFIVHALLLCASSLSGMLGMVACSPYYQSESTQLRLIIAQTVFMVISILVLATKLWLRSSIRLFLFDFYTIVDLAALVIYLVAVFHDKVIIQSLSSMVL